MIRTVALTAFALSLFSCSHSSALERFSYEAKPATVADPKQQIEALLGADNVQFGEGYFKVRSPEGPHMVQFERIGRVDLLMKKVDGEASYGVTVIDTNLVPMLEWLVHSREDAEKLADAITALMPPLS